MHDVDSGEPATLRDDPAPHAVPPVDETPLDGRFRRVATWIAILGTWLLAAYFFGFLVYASVGDRSTEHNWFLRVVEQHFAATIGLPLSAISAACIVLVLKVTTGPIEFEALGFKFRGASGPVVLWLFCFLAFIAGVRLLWSV